MGRNDDIGDVPGILVGHDTLPDAATGCTVICCEGSAVGAVDVRGGAPGTRETDLLDPRCMMQEVHAVLLAGGSAFGLDAATGVMRVLEERGIGFDVGMARVPIVPAAVLFDLGIGRSEIRPDAASGVRATEAALASQAGDPVAQGSVGAGTGATVGKMGGPMFATKGGIGSASETTPEGYTVGALVAVNALGDVYDPQTGRIVAGARSPSGQCWLADDLADDLASQQGAATPPDAHIFPGAQTTIGVIATDAPFSKAELSKLAQMAHDGLALAIRPTHTPLDGDTLFALRTSRASTQPATNATLSLTFAGAAATQAIARAIVKAVRAATSLAGVPALRDLPFAQS
ncbi:MAG: P1 family peptidase [Ktedonobacterales bacterium]